MKLDPNPDLLLLALSVPNSQANHLVCVEPFLVQAQSASSDVSEIEQFVDQPHGRVKIAPDERNGRTVKLRRHIGFIEFIGHVVAEFQQISRTRDDAEWASQ